MERVLDDLIHRLVNSENVPEVRAALIEARRLKNVAARWAAIPPPPDARREMLARVMELSDSIASSPLSPKASARPEPVTGPHKPFVPRKSPEPQKSPEHVTGPHKPFIPRTSPAPFPPKPSKETAAAETLSPPPLVSAQRTSPSIRALEDADDEVRVPRPAPVPNIEHRGKPLTLRPPQPFAPAQSSAPGGEEPKPTPIKAVAARGSETLDGLSSTISSSKLRARQSPSGIPDLPPLAPRTTSKPPVLSASPTPLPPSPGDVSVAVAVGVTLVRAASAEWQPHPLWKGTSVKLLSHDAEGGEYTALIRLSKGSTLPPRRHVSTEEMWMIEGVAIVGEIEMKAGEYSKGDAGSVHPKVVSINGCTFLLRGNENDEILSAPSESPRK